MHQSSSKIEKAAIRVVEEAIEACPRLSTYISQNDKTPVWDGSIYLYANNSERSDSLKGRISVQVKGKEFSQIAKPPFMYRVKVSDLRNFLYDGGCLYFVVAIGPNGNRKIYYKSLTVVVIKNLLNEIDKSQRSCVMRMSALPCDINQITSIFENFLNDRNRQHSFANQKILSLEELQKMPGFKSYTITTTVCGETAPTPQDLLAFSEINDVHVYANIEGSPIPIPTSDVVHVVRMDREADMPITIRGTEYYNQCKIIHTLGKVTIAFGSAFTFEYDTACTYRRLKSEAPSTLHEHIQMIRFILALCDANEFSIGEQTYYLNDQHSFNIEEIQHDLVLFERAQKIMDYFHIHTPVNISDLHQKDWDNIKILYQGFIDQTPIERLRFDGKKQENSWCDFTFGNIHIRCLAQQIEDQDAYTLDNAFDLSKYALSLERTNGSMELITVYSILDKDSFCKYSNINFENITPEYQKAYQFNPNIVSYASETVNELILAYDTKRDDRMLQAASSLVDWLLPLSIPNISECAKQIDLAQICKRQGVIIEELRLELCKIIDGETPASPIDKVSAYILLDDTVSAERYYSKLSNQDKEYFQELPIYSLYQTEKCNSANLQK